MVELLSERGELAAVCVLYAGSANNSLEELTLKDDLGSSVNIIRLDAQALVELLEVLVFFLLCLAAGLVATIFGAFKAWLDAISSAVDEVKLVDLV